MRTKQGTNVATHCVTLNMVAKRSVPTMPPTTRLAHHVHFSATAGVSPMCQHADAFDEQASIRPQSHEVRQDWCSTRTRQEIQLRSKRRDEFHRTENSQGASNQVQFRFVAREADIRVASQRTVDVPVTARRQTSRSRESRMQWKRCGRSSPTEWRT